MAEWKTKVRLGDLLEQYENEEIELQDVGDRLIERLKETEYANEYPVDVMIDELRTLEDEEHFDAIMSTLYDFGDRDHCIWFDPS